MNSATSTISGNCGVSTADQRAHAVSMSMFLELLLKVQVNVIFKRSKGVITYSGLARVKQKL
jgi:hypothetical protein